MFLDICQLVQHGNYYPKYNKLSSLICDVHLPDLLPAFAIIVAYMTLCWDCPFYD